MGSMENILYLLLVAWGMVTVVLVCMMIYRSVLENREEDQLFLDNAESHLAAEQRAILTRIQKLHGPILALMVLSGVMLVALAGVWVYRGFSSF